MKNRNFTNLNINPCKVCMPMGAVTAFKGIESSMVILHGSQGCSTYIRRHMAEHYNEPVDIASSSLNEEGTVYGGEKNLKTGLENIIALYKPSIIGVCTTCLAETIGEDIERIVEEFMMENNGLNTLIVPVHTAGYAGSQPEGYYAALRAILESAQADRRKNGIINIIPGFMSPGDIRNIKSMLDSFEIEYIVYPDISETLDAPCSKAYSRIPEGGTTLRDISRMAGAVATIELGMTVSDAVSPGKFLEQLYGVPLARCSLPVGLQNTDAFLGLVSEISGRKVPINLQKDRGRLIDGMIDSHKYNGEGKAIVFGDPDMVHAITGLCAENGIKPLLACSGSRNKKFSTLVSRLDLPEMPLILEDTDFETILDRATVLKPNILIGSSDGKVLTEKLGIPLVRAGYPIHDRVGGQRLVYSGYNGSLKLLDDISNTLLEEKHRHYRQDSYKKYFDKAEASLAGAGPNKAEAYEIKTPAGTTFGKSDTRLPAAVIKKKTSEHPCFTAGACTNARLHIPVAPACNISCNYCNRKFDCVNESRPGVTSKILSPVEAAERFYEAGARLKNLKVVGIAGPGDALANFESTSQAIELIRHIDPDITFCLSTNGLMLPEYASQLIDLGVTHITVTVNAVEPAVGAAIYGEISYRGSKKAGEEAAGILLENQLSGLSYLSSRGIVCKVNTVMIMGVNDGHIRKVVEKVGVYGAQLSNIMPLIPAPGSVFENMPATSKGELNRMRKHCEDLMKQMYHCRQCRADAAGTLENDRSLELFEKQRELPAGHGPKSAGMPLAACSSGKGCATGKRDGTGRGCEKQNEHGSRESCKKDGGCRCFSEGNACLKGAG